MPEGGPRIEKERALSEKMCRLGIEEADILEKFIRSSGPGGQNVNKNATCVYLKHLPSGIEVKCQRERSQALNRLIARKILADKIEALALRKEAEEKMRICHIRRQKRRRSRLAKLKMLEAKRRRSQKKLLRAKVRDMGM